MKGVNTEGMHRQMQKDFYVQDSLLATSQVLWHGCIYIAND